MKQVKQQGEEQWFLCTPEELLPFEVSGNRREILRSERDEGEGREASGRCQSGNGCRLVVFDPRLEPVCCVTLPYLGFWKPVLRRLLKLKGSNLGLT